MSEGTNYVRLDEHGVYRVGATRVMFDGVVAGFQQGFSPETIRQQFPALSLEEVYGSIAHYLKNQTEFDEYLRRQQKVWEFWKSKSEEQPSPVLERLRALQRAQSQGQP